MNGLFAFLLIFVSCCLHVAWNTISKGCKDKEAFTWLVTLTGTLSVLPCFILAQIFQPGPLGWREIAYATVSGFFESIYTIALFASYKHIDLSVAYPIARGFAPIATLFLGFAIGDAFKPMQMPAVATALAGVCILAWDANKRASSNTKSTRPALGITLSIITAVSIACYHLVDRGAINTEPKPNGISYLFAMHTSLLFFISLWMLPRKKAWSRIVKEWKAGPGEAVAVGTVSFIAYLLVIFALSLEDATMVTAGRNLGIVLSLASGAIFLKEKLSKAKVIGATLVTAGVILIFLAGTH